MEYREPLKTGAVLVGDYRVDQVLGAGGFGITYLAEDIKLQRQVAIKEYFPADFALRDATHSVRARSGELGETFRWGLDSFLREAQILARFEHPAITRVIRIVEANNTAYMVLRYEEGVPLRQHLDTLGRPMTEPEIRNLLYPLIEALETVHAQSILHRDISPDNIIIRPDGRGVLIDFGAARRAVADKSQALTGIVREGYSPPEQFGNGGRQGPWTDIYALGAVLYHAVTGKKPMTSIHRILEDQLVPATTAAAGRYGENLLHAIERALRLKSSERPQTMAAFRQLVIGRARVVNQPEPPLAETSAEPPLAPGPQPLPVVNQAAQPTEVQPVSQPQRTPQLAQPPAPSAEIRPTPPSRPPVKPMAIPAAVSAPTAIPVTPAPLAPPSAVPLATPGTSTWMPLSALLFSFHGRINRGKFWLGYLLSLFVALFMLAGIAGLAFVSGEFDRPEPGPITSAGAIMLAVIYIWMAFALYVKRAHDRGWSGWFCLLMLVPVIGLWPTIELLFLPGDPGENRFGASPLPPPSSPRST